MTSEMRAPHRMRDSTSRPNVSVPSRKSPPGGCSRSMMFWSTGSYGASHGASTAPSTTSMHSSTPTEVVGLRSIAARNRFTPASPADR